MVKFEGNLFYPTHLSIKNFKIILHISFIG